MDQRHVLYVVAIVSIAGAVCGVYGGAIHWPFIFDDAVSVAKNPSIQTLWPLLGTSSGPLNPPKYITTSGRPLVNLSLAVNYYFGQLDPTGYHVFNLMVHALSAILLMAIVRRTLQLDYFGGRFDRVCGPLAFISALIWAVHPLQTETVEYVTQRSELLVSFFYLATLYSSLRYWNATSTAARTTWLAVAAFACLAGMASKEVMVTAPIVVLLFERTFIAGSFKEALRRSWPLYVGLFLSWGLLLALNYGAPRAESAGFSLGVPTSTWWLTQSKVLLMYLKLAIFPSPLLIHYQIPYFTTLADAWPWVFSAALLATATLVLLWRRNPIGFVGAWVFLVLSPTLVVPVVTEVAAERRMYLPLAALVPMAVVAVYELFQHASSLRRGKMALLALFALLLIAVLGGISRNRLAAYRSELTLWQDNLIHQPNDAIALNNVACELYEMGQHEEAIPYFERGLQLNPKNARFHFNLANALLSANRPRDAMEHFQSALEIDPAYAEAANGLAWLLATSSEEDLRDPLRAVDLAKTAAELNPQLPGTLNTLGVALYRAGKWQAAIECLNKSTMTPTGGNSFDWFYLAMAHYRLGQYDEAHPCYDKAVAWKLTHAATNKELLRLQSEVEELLASKSTTEAKPQKAN